MKRTKANDKRYGGADRICEVNAEKDILLMIVGRNTGKEAKETLIDRKISACSHGTRLPRVRNVAEVLKDDSKLFLSVDVLPPISDTSSCRDSS